MKMQLTDVFCYLVLMITISTSYVRAQREQRDLQESELKTEKRISKREAAIFIDNFPVEPMYGHRPKIIYRRISKPNYMSPKPKYGPPNKYRSVKPWKPLKKYRRTVKPKYGPPSYKRRPTKPKYGPPKSHKPIYGPPKKLQFSSFYPIEPEGFGEPPIDADYQQSKQSFGEPPYDSYGDPVSSLVKNPYIPEQYSPPASFSDTFVNFDDVNKNFGQDYKSWISYQSDQNVDNSVGYSKKRPIYVKPERLYEAQDEDFDFNPYSHIYKHREFYLDQKPLPFEKKKTLHYANRSKTVKARKSPKPNEEPEDEMLVVDRYAKPEDEVPVGGRYRKPENENLVGGRYTKPENEVLISGRYTKPENEILIGGRYTKPENEVLVGGRYKKPENEVLVGGRYSKLEDEVLVGGHYTKPEREVLVGSRYTKPENELLVSGHYTKPDDEVLVGGHYTKPDDEVLVGGHYMKSDDEVLVGGRYAEPPEKYVPKFTISQYSEDEDFTPLKGYIDPNEVISATMSPYVNYKNSNMAFSPQNLNDAFSIVDK